MLGTIRIVKEKDQSWKLIFNGNDYHIGTGDSGIMSILKPKDNQTCMITDLTSEKCGMLLPNRRWTYQSVLSS